ncbi:MAG: hypothetical protein V7459_01215 [Oceanicoccus sp.]
MFNLRKVIGDIRLVTVLVFVVASSCASALNDPTRPSTYHPTAGAQTLTLESVLIGSDRKIAVINGSVVTEGERVKGFAVIEIRKDSVKGRSNGKIVILNLDHTEIRRKN